MDVPKLVEELKSIQNPPDREKFLSMLVDQKMAAMEQAYKDKSVAYLTKLRVEIKEKDLHSIAKSLTMMAKSQSRLLVILNNLIKD